MTDLIKSLVNTFKKENAEKEIAKLIVDVFYQGNPKQVIKNLYKDFLTPIMDRLDLILPEFYCSSLLLEKLLFDPFGLKMSLEKEIIKYNRTSACSADESRTVINALINLLVTGEHSSLQETYSEYWKTIKDKEEQERLKAWEDDERLTYWSCKRFKNTQEVLFWIVENEK